MMRLIFVHGSWMNENCWAPVRPLLEARGCETMAVNLPGHGEDETPLNELAQSDADSGIDPAMRPAPDWSTLDLDKASRSPLFFHGVDPLVAEPFLAQWRAEPVAPLGTPVQLGDADPGVLRWYVRTEPDRVVSPALQVQMLEATPCQQRSLPTGHLPMFAQPKALAAVLLEAAK